MRSLMIVVPLLVASLAVGQTGTVGTLPPARTFAIGEGDRSVPFAGRQP